MKNRFYVLLFVLVAAAVVACSPYRQLMTDFADGQNSLSYLHTSTKRLNMPKNPNVKLLTPVISARLGSGDVKRISTQVMPLIVFNSCEYRYECVLGRNQISEDVPQFLASSLREETGRSGTFKIKEDSAADFSIDVEIDSISARGPYQASREWIVAIIFLIHHKEDQAGPGRAFCSYHYRLRKGNEIVLDGFVKSEKTIEMLRPQRRTSFSDFRGFYRANLVESLSETIKMNNEKLVRKINQYFRDNPT